MSEQDTQKVADGVARALMRETLEHGKKMDEAIDSLQLKMIERARKRGMSEAQIAEILLNQ